MKLAIKIILTGFFLFSINTAKAEFSKWETPNGEIKTAKLRIINSPYLDEKDEKNLIIGFEFNIEPGWKIYGQDSFGIGLPPSAEFEGLKSAKIIWPKAIPQEDKIGDEILRYSIYKDKIILPVEVDFAEINSQKELSVQVNYGLCKDICIPVSSNFKIKIASEKDQKALGLIQKFLDKKIIENQESALEEESSTTLLSILIAAFIGGLILNIMPCVLPVLGIKLISVIKSQNAKISRIRIAFFYTFLGIISCFIGFAIFAISVMEAGNAFNWGLQFQNPYFLIFLLTVILFFIANTLGIFELKFNYLVSNFLHRKISEKENNIFVPNFLSGILAVLLATPCSAPFLGAAISFSITQNPKIILLIFSVMGIGFAFPYLVLMISPHLVNHLPKSGAWMLKVKKIMAAFLIATLIWLIYVLSNNIGYLPAMLITVLCVAFFACFKIKYKSLKALSLLILLVSIFCLPKSFENDNSKNAADKLWQKFDEKQINRHVKQGKTVIIDVTASWCLTCKFNKVRILHSKEFEDKLSEENIVAMRADITKPDPKVTDFINRHNRFAIPFNAVFGPCAKNGLLASELLNKERFLKKIDQASCK